MNRKGYLGASDGPVVMGKSPYKKPKELWLEKTGRIEPEDLSDNEYVQEGIKREGEAFPKIKALTGLEFFSLHDQQFPVDGYDFIKVRPDGVGFDLPVVGDTVYWSKVAIKNGYSLEIKTVGDKQIREFHKNGIPEHYYIQVQAQLAGTNQDKSLFFAQSRESENVYIEWVDRDNLTIKYLIEAYKNFWHCIINDEFIEIKQEEKHYIEPVGIEAEDDENNVNLIEELSEKIRDFKDKEKEIKADEKRLKELLKNFSGYRSIYFKIDWITRKTSSLDKRGLESFLKSKGANLKAFQITSESAPFIKIKRNETINKKFIP